MNEELGERPFMEWVPARDTDDASSAPTQLDGASLLILRPGRHNVGAIDSDTWLKLIAWHGERATTTWARKQRSAAMVAPPALRSSSIAEAPAFATKTPRLLLTGNFRCTRRTCCAALTKNFPYSAAHGVRSAD